MSLYPKYFHADSSEIQFNWNGDAANIWGIWFIAQYLRFKLGAKISNRIWTSGESMYTLALNECEIYIHQENYGIEEGIVVNSNDKSSQTTNLIQKVLNESILFKHQ